MDIALIIGSITGSIGFWELIKFSIKFLINRKSNSRKAESEADASEFSVLRDTMIFLESQLKNKEERFAEQTALVRKLNAEYLELVRENTMLKTERGLKLCERRNCLTREPQSGY